MAHNIVMISYEYCGASCTYSVKHTVATIFDHALYVASLCGSKRDSQRHKITPLHAPTTATLRQVDNVAECMAKDVARACSRLTETFFRYITRSVVDLHKGYCNEVVLKNLKRSVHAEMPSFFELWSLAF
ncbi:hypothetical protein AVEN_169456-1 [Araneus ventricosus]|uniref:Uncharacterized protein n=1 Tax=Araneus ventricosus TaxID=182803 RepID=A0A4Y2Q6C8_ARAVE|nr:hypothetical protein AVEN_155394-1 [Araneus ventricosus]GBN58802.1 hypothetical protein AVEN_5592-1 [Araneus ventricosus]GBN58856.1 hypothetical protein AVEN_11563-1 [Araneus ventricosus]GBN58928.1 hypothetical protein AVEN_169456-1 [Araneus ventricosus]